MAGFLRALPRELTRDLKSGFFLDAIVGLRSTSATRLESVEFVTRRGVVRRAAWGFELKLKRKARKFRPASRGVEGVASRSMTSAAREDSREASRGD